MRPGDGADRSRTIGKGNDPEKSAANRQNSALFHSRRQCGERSVQGHSGDGGGEERSRKKVVADVCLPASRALIGNELADRYCYPDTIRIRQMVLLYFRTKARLIRLLSRGSLLQEQSLMQIFEATQYDAEGISYRMPDHVRAAQQSPW